MRPWTPLQWDRRAAVALTVGVMAPMLLGMAAVTIDSGFWIVGQTRLQIAADAGALASSYLLNNATVKAMAPTDQAKVYTNIASYEANAAATKLVGAMTVNAAYAADYSSVTVTVTAVGSRYLSGIFPFVTQPTLQATATASLKTTGGTAACLLTLGKTGTDITVDNLGNIVANGCPIFSNSTGNPSIYLNSGTLSAPSIGAAGTITQSNSGSNTQSGTLSANSTPATDPNAKLVPPATPSTCDANNGNYTGYSATPYTFAMHSGSTPYYVFCGNTTIGGNASTVTFSPGIYYVVNGDLTFNNASVNSASGVTFLLTGSSPGSFSWTNYSNTSTQITAPTTGPTAGTAIWQVCNSGGGQTTSFQGGSTVLFSGTLYMPCSNVEAGNNAQIAATLGQSMGIISNRMYVHGSAAIRTASSSGSGNASSGSTTSAVLTQ